MNTFTILYRFYVYDYVTYKLDKRFQLLIIRMCIFMLKQKLTVFWVALMIHFFVKMCSFNYAIRLVAMYRMYFIVNRLSIINTFNHFYLLRFLYHIFKVFPCY